ncbi:hypothetical protein V1460_35105 [Streptomyces sp. SCSIO 30461]|uniref:hypothetical protein n=1 Tax=Streptomyces sp. SCSIO 30461 TaxID=3118085 RepID=UPI0030D3CB54
MITGDAGHVLLGTAVVVAVLVIRTAVREMRNGEAGRASADRVVLGGGPLGEATTAYYGASAKQEIYLGPGTRAV